MLPSEVSFSGRDFSAAELALVRETVHDFSNLSLTELSKTICELLMWKRPTFEQGSWGAGEHGRCHRGAFGRIHGVGLMIILTSFPMM